jgi:hypothetical protein
VTTTCSTGPRITDKMSTSKSETTIMHQAKKKCRSLINAVKADPANGIQWWLKTHHQEEGLAEVALKINRHCESQNFKLSLVPNILQPFTLKEEFLGILDWFSTADQKLNTLEKGMIVNQIPNPKAIQDALKELQFIINEDQFFAELALEPLHDRISYMFDELNKRLAEANLAIKLEKDAQAQKQAIQLQKVKNMEVEEHNKTIELEKQKVVAQKEKLVAEEAAKKALKAAKETEILRLDKVKEFQSRQAEEKRAQELQGQYQSMQIKMVSDEELVADLKRRQQEAGLSEQVLNELEQLVEKN